MFILMKFIFLLFKCSLKLVIFILLSNLQNKIETIELWIKLYLPKFQIMNRVSLPLIS